MSLHGLISVNGTTIAGWSAKRVVTADPNVYECEVIPDARDLAASVRFRLEHRYEDGAVALAAKVLSHATNTPPPTTPTPNVSRGIRVAEMRR